MYLHLQSLFIYSYFHHRTSSGKPAIDFITDRYDIRIPCDDLDSSDPDSKYSLRVSSSDLSWPHGTHKHPVALGEDPHTEYRADVHNATLINEDIKMTVFVRPQLNPLV